MIPDTPLSGDLDEPLLSKLRNKEYRDGFIESHIRTGLAYQIRELREARGWSQTELALRSNKKQSVIARVENPDYGKFSLSTLLELASAFDVALLVRFVPFTELVERTQDLSPSGLNVASFKDDYASRGEGRSFFVQGSSRLEASITKPDPMQWQVSVFPSFMDGKAMTASVPNASTAQ